MATQAEREATAARVAAGNEQMRQEHAQARRDGDGARRWMMKHAANGHATMPAEFIRRATGDPAQLAAAKAEALAAIRGAVMSRTDQLLAELIARVEELTNEVRSLKGVGAQTAVSVAGGFPADELTATVNDGKRYWKVRGGQFAKFGVTVWPETLKAAGFDPDALDPMKPVSLAGWTAWYVVNEEGKAQKVTRLEPPKEASPERSRRNGRHPDTDWEVEAATATDPLLFDTAIARAYPWYQSADKVEKFRLVLWPEDWDPGHAPAYTVALAEYARQRQAGREHAAAKVEALNRYSRQLAAAAA